MQRATESQIETGRDTGRETGREPVRTRESQIEPAGARVGVPESHREPERARENCRKLSKYALGLKKMAECAPRADSTLYPTLALSMIFTEDLYQMITNILRN